MSDLPVISVQELRASFRQNDGRRLAVLDGISFDIRQNETVAVIGHSGCGKTTLLRAICGFTPVDSGYVFLDGQPHTRPDRNMLMLFQDFNQLLPWKTVLGNVVHPLLATGAAATREEAGKRAMRRIADVGMAGFEKSYPHQLSGGMKQRVAVARALALQPRVMLLDEPFASLDSITRSTLQVLTGRVCDKYGISALLVTHSVEEAVCMADRILVMDRTAGKIRAMLENPVKDAPPEQRVGFIAEILAILGS